MAGNANSGRKKGSTNKRRFAQRLAKEYDIEPLDYMLQVLNDKKNDKAERMDAAKSAAPYIHPKLANVAMSHDGGLEIINRIERSIVKANTTDS